MKYSSHLTSKSFFAICMGYLILLSEAKCDDALKTRFTREAPEQWRKYREAINKRDAYVTIDINTFDNQKNITIRKSQRAIKQISGNFLLYEHSTLVPKPIRGMALCINDKHFFKIVKHKKDWVVEELQAIKKDDPSSINSINIDDRPSNAIEQSLCSNLYLHWHAFPELVKDKGFIINNVSQSTLISGGIVVDFTLNTVHKSLPNISSGSVTLLPSQYWTISQFEISGFFGESMYSHRFTMKGSKKFDTINSNAIPLITETYARLISSNNPVEYDTTYVSTFTEHNATSIAQSDFSLSAYGIYMPSIEFSNEGSEWKIPWFAYAAAFGIVCLFLAWFIKRKRTQTA